MFDKIKQNRISAKHSNVIIGNNAHIQNNREQENNVFSKVLGFLTALIVLITAVIEFLSR